MTTPAVSLVTPCCQRQAGLVPASDSVDSYKRTCSGCRKRYLALVHWAEVRWVPRDRFVPKTVVPGPVLRALPAPLSPDTQPMRAIPLRREE